MAKPILYLPTPLVLECDINGKISIKTMTRYFKTLGSIPNQIRVQLPYLPKSECTDKLYQAIKDIEDFINDVTGFLLTDVFIKIKNFEHEMEYKVREFIKEIDVFFQKKILELLMKVVEIIAAPIIDILKTPIPFIGTVTLIDSNGEPYEYQPTVIDFFTKEGKKRIKGAMAERLDDVREFFRDIDEAVTDFFNGEWNLKIREYSVEELWQKAIDWMHDLIADTINTIINAVINFLKKVPFLKELIEAIEIIQDPSKALHIFFNKLYTQFKKEYQKLRDDFISGKIFEDLAKKLLDKFIDKILSIEVPLFGSLRELLEFDLEDEIKRFKVNMKEYTLAKLKDQWNTMMRKIKTFFTTSLMKKIVELVEKVLKKLIDIAANIPIVKKAIEVYKIIKAIVTGQIDMCMVISIILKPLFELFDGVYKILPLDCFDIQYTPYGITPELLLGKT
jgi:hypothetical protein